MSKKDKLPITQYIDKRIIKRIRTYMIVLLVMLVIIVFEGVQGTFNIPMVIFGIITGMVIGILVSRMYSLSWDEESNNVIDRMDWIGAVILVFYLIFLFNKTHLLEYLVHGSLLLTLSLSITVGTMLGRILNTRRSIDKVLEASNILKNPL